MKLKNGQRPKILLNGLTGDAAQLLVDHDYDPGVLRPWKDPDGRTRVTLNAGTEDEYSPVFNATSTLRRDEWLALDAAIIAAAKPRLKAVGDMYAAGLRYSIPGGMGKTVLHTERQSDINEAEISMDGMRESVKDRPVHDYLALPLPIIHKDFEFSLRTLAVSRSGGLALDTSTGTLAGRRVAEKIEGLLIGSVTYPSYAGGTITGLTSHANRNTKDITAPTESGWTPATLVTEILQMRKQSQDDYHFGPWMVYVNKDWDVYLDADYSSAKGDNTLRDRIRRIEGIMDIRTLDYLTTSYAVILVQMTEDVVRMVEAMPLTTVQWESKGGMLQHFKVMTIQVPQLRADINGNMGLVHGAPA